MLGAPETRRDDVVEVLHGVAVADPYRWLEDSASEEVGTWVDAQNALTRATLDNAPGRAAIHAQLDQLLTTGSVSSPVIRGRRHFYQRRDGRSDQPVLVVRDAPATDERVIVNPNTLSERGIVALDWWVPSKDGRLLAYGTSEGGTELSTLRVLDVETLEHFDAEVIPYTRAASIAWLPDAGGFYYTRYPEPGSVPAGEEMYHRHVFFHAMGADWRADEQIFGADRAREDWPYVHLSHSGRWLIVEVSQGWVRSEVYLLDRTHLADGFVPVHAGDNSLATTEFVGERLLVHTNRDAPNYALFEADPQHPERERWRLILAARPDVVLQSVSGVAGRIVAHELRNASSQLLLYGLDGGLQTQVALPEIGSVLGVGGEWEGDRLVFGFTSFARPPAAYAVDLATGATHVFAQGALPPGFDAAGYAVRQEWYTSKDGTRVSLFVIQRHDLVPNGDTPTVLNGYGGFNVSRTPMFIAALPVWLDAGGVYAIANLRGGGEYGEAWHQAGMLGNKQNVFDDFVAAARFLVAQGITRPERLGIIGGSNGGLLVGAALTQRPDLFGAVVCQVPLLDMLRYQNLRIARLWIAEYGSSEDPEQFKWLYAYSPYHHVSAGVRYPAVFLLTAEGDSRVDPMHARKMAAALQSATGSDHPILLRVETAAGHGQGKPRSKQLEGSTDIWTFLSWQLGVPH